MKIVLLFVIIASAVILTGIILLQESKGSELGAGFGRGAASGLAGQAPMGGATFLTRVTAILAAVFFASTLALSLFTARQDRDDLLETLGAEENGGFADEIDLDALDSESGGADAADSEGAAESGRESAPLDAADGGASSPIVEDADGEGEAKEQGAADRIPE